MEKPIRRRADPTRRAPGKRQGALLLLLGILLLVCGLLLLFLPTIDTPAVSSAQSLTPARLLQRGGELAAVALCWLLVAAAALSLLRMVFARAGFAAAVLALCNTALLGALGWFTTPADIVQLEGARLLLSILLFATGVIRIAAFAQRLQSMPLPLHALCGAAECLAGTALLLGLPDYNVFFLYFFIGLCVTRSGIAVLQERGRMRTTRTAAFAASGHHRFG